MNIYILCVCIDIYIHTQQLRAAERDALLSLRLSIYTKMHVTYKAYTHEP